MTKSDLVGFEIDVFCRNDLDSGYLFTDSGERLSITLGDLKELLRIARGNGDVINTLEKAGIDANRFTLSESVSMTKQGE